MGLIIFWSVIALSYLALVIVTSRELRKLEEKLGNLDEVSTPGIKDKKGNFTVVAETLYNAIKAILVTSRIAFLVAAVAATASFLITTC